MSPLEVLKFLEDRNVEVLFFATFGSFGTDDWSEESDIDIFIVVRDVDDETLELLPRDKVDLIICNENTLEFALAPPFMIDLAFSNPLVDKIGLRDRCLRNLKSKNIVRWLLNRLKMHDSILSHMLRSPEKSTKICGSEAIKAINTIRLALSVISGRRISRSEIIRDIEENLKIDMAPFIQQFYAKKTREKSPEIPPEVCVNTLRKILEMVKLIIKKLENIRNTQI